MLICALVITFFTVVVTGPAGIEWCERRRARLDAPAARVLYLPTSACRARGCSPDCRVCHPYLTPGDDSGK